MSSTTTTPRETSSWRADGLPPLTLIDRIALHLGLQLTLWSRRHATEADRSRQAQLRRVEQARVSRAAGRAASSVDRARTERSLAGPRW